MEFHPFAPPLEYQQNDSNYCNFLSLASLLTASGEVFSKRDIAGQIEESLVCLSKGYSDRIKISNAVMIEKEQNKR